MNAARIAMPSKSSWHADGLRWIGSLFANLADYLDRTSLAAASLHPMPRHTSFEEVLRDVRNRSNAGLDAGIRPHYW